MTQQNTITSQAELIAWIEKMEAAGATPGFAAMLRAFLTPEAPPASREPIAAETKIGRAIGFGMQQIGLRCP